MKIKALTKFIASATVGLLATTLSITCYASSMNSFAKNQALQFMILYVDKAYAPLSQVSTLAKLFYQQYGTCPSSDRYELKLPDDSVFQKVTNQGCVAMATYKASGVPTPLKLKQLGMGPRYVTFTKTWSFDDLLYATDILTLPGNEFKPVPGSPSAILNLSGYFIGGVYAASPYAYLSSTAERQPEKLN